MELLDIYKRKINSRENENLFDIFLVCGFVAVFDDTYHAEIDKAVDEVVEKAIELEKSNVYHFEVLVELMLKKKNIRSSCHITSLSSSQITREDAVKFGLVSDIENDCDKEK